MSSSAPRRFLVGVGNAGVTVLDLLALENPGMKGLLCVNNDPESLSASVVTDRLTVPEGDPSEGFLAIDGPFGDMVSGASSVVLCGGLGGESGSFLLPALAILAKSSGITVAACVGMPFSFEGKQKRELAASALEKLRTVCDAVAVIENDRLTGGSPSTAAVGEAFSLSDRTILAALQALQGMITNSGPVKITRSDIKSVLGVPGAVTLFGSGTAKGPNRLHEALEHALKSPLLTAPGKNTPGGALAGASTVLLLLRGPADLSFAEVQVAVTEIERIAGEGCQIKTGVHADLSPDAPITLSITASSGGGQTAEKPTAEKPKTTLLSEIPEAKPLEPAAQVATRAKPEPAPVADSIKPVSSAKPIKSTAGAFTKGAKQSAGKQTQGTLDLDSYQRGRFDKSEPTIVAGEDLDVPTFLRKGIKLTPPHRN